MTGFAMPSTATHPRRWWWVRAAYRTALITIFFGIAFYFGPNWFLFHKWTSLTATDFVPVVEEKCVPTVRAVKAYARDHGGHMPETNDDLGPAFKNWTEVGMVRRDGFEFLDFGHAMQRIEYKFGPTGERWVVEGVFLNATIPVPAVADPPTSQP